MAHLRWIWHLGQAVTSRSLPVACACSSRLTCMALLYESQPVQAQLPQQIELLPDSFISVNRTGLSRLSSLRGRSVRPSSRPSRQESWKVMARSSGLKPTAPLSICSSRKSYRCTTWKRGSSPIWA